MADFHKMRYAAGSLILACLVLGSCAKPSCCSVAVSDYEDLSPLKKAISDANRKPGFTAEEIRKCFGNGVKNDLGATIYPLLNEKTGKKRYCHVAFSDLGDDGRKYIGATSFKNYNAEACDMLALKCLRPEAYKHIKANFTIEDE